MFVCFQYYNVFQELGPKERKKRSLEALISRACARLKVSFISACAQKALKR